MRMRVSLLRMAAEMVSISSPSSGFTPMCSGRYLQPQALYSASISSTGGMAGKGGAATLGIITAVLAVACNIFGACTRYYGYTYPLKDGTYSGTLQFIALIAFAVVAVVFTIAACSAKSKAKAEAAAAAAE